MSKEMVNSLPRKGNEKNRLSCTKPSPSGPICTRIECYEQRFQSKLTLIKDNIPLSFDDDAGTMIRFLIFPFVCGYQGFPAYTLTSLKLLASLFTAAKTFFLLILISKIDYTNYIRMIEV